MAEFELVASGKNPTLDSIYSDNRLATGFNEGDLAKIEFDCSGYDPVVIAQRFNDLDSSLQAVRVELWSKTTIQGTTITAYPKTGFPIIIAVAIGVGALTFFGINFCQQYFAYRLKQEIIQGEIDNQSKITDAILKDVETLDTDTKMKVLAGMLDDSKNTLGHYFDDIEQSDNGGLLGTLGLDFNKYMPLLIIGIIAIAGLFIFMNLRK